MNQNVNDIRLEALALLEGDASGWNHAASICINLSDNLNGRAAVEYMLLGTVYLERADNLRERLAILKPEILRVAR